MRDSGNRISQRRTLLTAARMRTIIAYDRVHMVAIYSTTPSRLPAYQLGPLHLTDPTPTPLNPANWTKSGTVSRGESTVYAVGRGSVTVSPGSTEDWVVYHSTVDRRPGWNWTVRAQKVGWNGDASPNFGTPVAPGQPVHDPSGECM